MSILGTVGVILILGFFFWMVVSSHNETASARPGEDQGSFTRVGYMTGLQGGSIEDAAIAKFALNRAKSGSADAREVATATAMQVHSSVD